MKLYLNVNENIKVKLKPEGYQYVADQHNELVKDIPSIELHTAEYYKSKADNEGYTKMQMHEFMALFGSFCNGSHIVPFETEILIETNL